MSDVEFERELCGLINRHSRENGSNTPDFILASYLMQCLGAFEQASNERERWYGYAHVPGVDLRRIGEEDAEIGND